MPTETATREALLALADALDNDADAHEAAGRRDAATRWRRDADEARARAEGAPPAPPRIDASEIIDDVKGITAGLRDAGQSLIDAADRLDEKLDVMLADRVAAALEAQAAEVAVVEQPTTPDTTPAESTLGAPVEPAPTDETPPVVETPEPAPEPAPAPETEAPPADDSAVIPPEVVDAEVVADPAVDEAGVGPAATWPEDGNASAPPAPEVAP